MIEEVTIVVQCRTCGADCARSEMNGVWVHMDDEVIIRGGAVLSESSYDHEADPYIIDIQEASTEPDNEKRRWESVWLPRRKT